MQTYYLKTGEPNINFSHSFIDNQKPKCFKYNQDALSTITPLQMRARLQLSLLDVES